MSVISSDDIRSAIDDFLTAQCQSKSEADLKKLNKATPGSKEEAQAKEKLAELQERYSKSVWLEQAANKMATQLKFGSHISKGVHPDSKGSNVNFRSTKPLPDGVVGSQLLRSPELEANGNAAALPLAAFFNTEIKEKKLYDLILSEHQALSGVFADDPELSDQYCKAFKTALEGGVTAPSTHERNKQLLWPMDEAVEQDNYHCLVPLYPSALTHTFYKKINGQRFSDENKEARDNRKKSKAEQKPYISIINLAATQLGGTKPQNVSLLTSKQGGRNYLLESLPPTYAKQHEYAISKKQESFFNKQLKYHCREGLNQLYGIIESTQNTVEVRDQRKQALDIILGQILQLADYIQRSYPAGWSKQYALHPDYKYWLDPKRAMLEEEVSFKDAREKTDWVHNIMTAFAIWLNNTLKEKFPKRKADFGLSENTEWLREIEVAVKASLRAGEGLFK